MGLALAGLMVFSERACPNDTGKKTESGQRIVSPIIGDTVLWASYLPGKEFARIMYTVASTNTPVDFEHTGGLWYKAFPGTGLATMQITPARRLADDEWYAECRIFQNGPKGMVLKSRRTTWQRTAIRCTTRDDGEEKLPCKLPYPDIRQAILRKDC